MAEEILARIEDHHEEVRNTPLTKWLFRVDQEYATGVVQCFAIDFDLVLKARRLGRAAALEHLAHRVPFSGEVDAESYRIVSLREDTETNTLLEMVYLVAYTAEYYAESNQEWEHPEGR